MQNNKPIDEDVLLNLKELLEDNFELLVKTFITDGSKRIEHMSCGIRNKDMDIIRLEAHALKGSARNVGAEPFAKLCEQVENQARDKDDTDFDSQLVQIQNEFEPLCRVIESHL